MNRTARRLVLLAIVALSSSCAGGDASGPRELKFGHVGEPGSLFALSAEEFVDFTLEFEWKTEDLGDNSGVFLRFLEENRGIDRLSGLERAAAARDRRVCACPVVAGSAEELPFADRMPRRTWRCRPTPTRGALRTNPRLAAPRRPWHDPQSRSSIAR